MVKIPNAFHENEIYREDSLTTKIPKIYLLAKEALISREERPKNLGEMAKNKETYCYAT